MNNSITENVTERISFDKMDMGQRTALINNYCMCFVAFFTGLALIKLLHTVCRKLGTKELVIPSMLLSLILASFSLVIFFCF